ncbi:hypothetical protein LMQOC1_30972 [Listeria monocytogenes QOC1]|nr:hypothetical protein LMQOC1_30972 [Listeria monocytogenes QOC1]
MAREGTVCKTLTTPITKFATFGERVSKIPVGTATAIPKITADREINKCCHV